MRRVEIQHNTPEQVQHYLEGALALVAELEIADDLRPVAFTKAVDLLAAKNVQIEQVQAGALGLMEIPRGRAG